MHGNYQQLINSRSSKPQSFVHTIGICVCDIYCLFFLLKSQVHHPQMPGEFLAISSPREVQEIDITLLLRGAACWASDECEVDLLALNKDPASLPDSGFLMIHQQNEK